MAKVKIKRLEIMTEIHEKLTIRQNSNEKIFCEACNCSVHPFASSVLLQIVNSESEEIKRNQIEDEIHFAGDSKMICGTSLKNYFFTTNKNEQNK